MRPSPRGAPRPCYAVTGRRYRGLVGVANVPRVKESRRRLEGGLACRTAAARRVRTRGARPKQPVACAPSPLAGLQLARLSARGNNITSGVYARCRHAGRFQCHAWQGGGGIPVRSSP